MMDTERTSHESDARSRWENAFLVFVVLAVVGVLVIARLEKWSSSAVSAAAFIVLTGAILVDSRITRAASRSEVNRTLAESRAGREAQDRPLIVIYFERRNEQVLLTVRNAGIAPAADVRFSFDQVISSAISERFHELPMLNQGMHTLPPGFSTTTSFDWFPRYVDEDHKRKYREAYGTELPMVYTGMVTYSHALSKDRVFTEPISLDLQYLEGHSWFVEKRVHHVAEEIVKIRRVMESTQRSVRDAVNLLDNEFSSHDDGAQKASAEPLVSDDEIEKMIGQYEDEPQF